MRIFFGIRRRAHHPSAVVRAPASEADSVARSIADSQARLLLIADRIAAGCAEPGDEARLRIQLQMTASFQKRLEKVVLPAGTGDDAEAWLRSVTEPSITETRQKDSH